MMTKFNLSVHLKFFFSHNKNIRGRGEVMLSSCVFLRSSSKPLHQYTKVDEHSELGEWKARPQLVSLGLQLLEPLL